MKSSFLKVFLSLIVLGAVISGCIKEEADSIESLAQVEETKVITYQDSELIEGNYIVVFHEAAVPTSRVATPSNYESQQEEMKEFAKSLLPAKRQSEVVISQAYVSTIKGVAMQLSETDLATLAKDKRVNYIEQDQMFHVNMGGPPGGGGGGGGSAPQVTPWGVTRVGGAMDGTNAGKAWIIDSGIDLDHEDLNVDVSNSATFLGGNSTPDDQYGHGTHVAGTVGAIDNTIGVVGVAAGATVVSVRVLNRRGTGSNSGVIAGVDYVAANASSGDVANMSLGGGISNSLDAAVSAAAGTCPFVIAAGNESQDANNTSPARVNGPDIYTVSSMAQGDNWSSFSNYANPPVDYCAPGTGVYSTYKKNGYATSNGTSMAAPHVCGILLIGGITTDGTVNGDPDGNADDIAHH